MTAKNILVYADWVEATEPKLVGILSLEFLRGKEIYNFEYSDKFLRNNHRIFLDPHLSFYGGKQFPSDKNNFGLFMDSMPDTWGRLLMKRREILLAKFEGRRPKILTDVDFLLGVHDVTRIGGLRFKLEQDGSFLDDSKNYPIPPWSSIRELQHGISIIETSEDDNEIRHWLKILLAPGSSLGGARPKSNILDQNKELWIAKFPSKNDTIDKAAWEFLAYRLALRSGISMSESQLHNISVPYSTFFTKRFDREAGTRKHFASAMTMLGYNEDRLKDHTPSYLGLAEFIQFQCTDVKDQLSQLWRRIVFNIAISNTDDHLRNHGFLLTNKGWILSPAFDINPSIEKEELAINIDESDNSLDYDLAKSVGVYFQLSSKEMEKIISEVKEAVKTWKDEAKSVGISNAEIMSMSDAFNA